MLETELAAQRQRAFNSRTPEERDVRARAIDVVTAARIAETAVGVGDSAPRFVLPDASGAEVDLRVLLQSGPVVVCFYRGGWCPYCNLELRAYQHRLDQIRRLGANLVAISPELPDRTLMTAENNELDFPVLSDVGNTAARAFRLTHRIDADVVAYQLGNGNDVAAFNGSDRAEVPLPATYVIDPAGIVRFAFVAADYTRRAEPDDVIARLRAMSADTSHRVSSSMAPVNAAVFADESLDPVPQTVVRPAARLRRPSRFASPAPLYPHTRTARPGRGDRRW
ncbi:MAG TPA: peroxiredoxin-like family protein [Mycobacterium sp.]|jgi:peroxiredoxin|nr:peroxiredoxin-like family protein [Mycobacterium sp.]